MLSSFASGGVCRATAHLSPRQSTSKRTLSHLQTSFIRTKRGAKTLHALASSSAGDTEAASGADDLARIKAELDSSLLLFKREHSRAIKLLYRQLPSDGTVYNAEELEEDLRDPFAAPASSSASEGPSYELFRLYHL